MQRIREKHLENILKIYWTITTSTYEEEPEIIRAIIISRGMSEYFVCFDSFGQIRSYSSKIPRDLIAKICNSMNLTVREGAVKMKND